MLWLLPAILALGFGAYQRRADERRWAASNAILFYLSLIIFMLAQAGVSAFQGSETSLLGYFVGGLALLAAGEGLAAWGNKRQAAWAAVAPPLAAGSFALGFDVLLPDEYSYIPAAILLVMVVLVAARAYIYLSANSKEPPAGLGVSVLAFALMIFAGTYKTMDRSWQLPWAYMASAGVLAFATAHLRAAAERWVKRKAPAAWLLALLAQLGVALMVVAAWFVYRDYL